MVTDISEQKHAEEALKESEERLKGFYHAAFESITISEQGKIIDINHQFAELFGYERDELIDKEVMGLIAEEDRELVLKNIRSGYDKPYEHKALKKDGSIIYIQVHGQQIQFQGRPARVTAIQDLTERKMAEEALRESEDKMKSVFRVAPIGIGIVYNRVILDVNKRFCEITGYSRDELIGKNSKEL